MPYYEKPYHSTVWILGRVISHNSINWLMCSSVVDIDANWCECISITLDTKKGTGSSASKEVDQTMSKLDTIYKDTKFDISMTKHEDFYIFLPNHLRASNLQELKVFFTPCPWKMFLIYVGPSLSCYSYLSNDIVYFMNFQKHCLQRICSLSFQNPLQLFALMWCH